MVHTRAQAQAREPPASADLTSHQQKQSVNRKRQGAQLKAAARTRAQHITARKRRGTEHLAPNSNKTRLPSPPLQGSGLNSSNFAFNQQHTSLSPAKPEQLSTDQSVPIIDLPPHLPPASSSGAQHFGRQDDNKNYNVRRPRLIGKRGGASGNCGLRVWSRRKRKFSQAEGQDSSIKTSSSSPSKKTRYTSIHDIDSQQKRDNSPSIRNSNRSIAHQNTPHLKDTKEQGRVASPGASNLQFAEQDLYQIEHWARRGNWPPGLGQGLPQSAWMEFAVPTNGGNQSGAQRAFARHKTPSSRGRRKRSPSGSSDGGLSEEQTALTSPTETQSSRYQTAAYEVLLEANNSFLRDNDFWMDEASADSSRALFRTLLTVVTDASKAGPFSHPAPQTTLFADNHFSALCQRLSGSNEARVVRDILPLIVPSAENLAITGAVHLGKLVDGVNQSWDSAQPLVSPRPQPDYSVGFARTAFTPSQLDRLSPYLGDRGATTQWESLFMGTRVMHFPFLTCEVKCGDQALAIADRQNAHSMTLAVRGIVELFRLVGSEAELNRRVLAFSISHDDNNVRIYGHYPVFENSMSGRTDRHQEQQSYTSVKYYRHKIHAYDFTVLDGRDKWTAYRIVRYIYDEWMPKHLESLCTVIDQLPISTLS